MASFIELIAKIKQKNNGTFKLVDAQDVECEDGKGLDEVLNEKLDKNQGVENVGKTMVVGADGNLVVGDPSPKNVYTKEEVDYLLDDKMDKPYVPIEITDNATIDDALAGNFKIDKIKGNTYQNVEENIVPTPQRPVPINSRKVKVNSEYVGLRSLKETGNLFDLKYGQLLFGERIGNVTNNGSGVIIENQYAITANLAVVYLKANTNYCFKSNRAKEPIESMEESGNDLNMLNVLKGSTPIIQVISGSTFTVNDSGYYYLRLYGTVGCKVSYTSVMLVEGTSAPSSYVAPTIRDYKIVDHTNKTAKIVRNVALYEDDHTGNGWTAYDNQTFQNSYFKNIKDMKKSNRIASYSNSFEVYDKSADNTNSMWIGVSANSNVFVVKTDFTTLDEWKAWLKNNDLEFLYPLVTPVEESIAYVETDVSEVGLSWQDTTSPSPTIKSEVQGVEEINILKTGKNLFDIDGNVNTTVDNAQLAKNSVQNGILTSNYNSNNETLGGQLIKTENGKQYTISLNVISIGTGNGAYIAIYRNGEPLYSPNMKVGAWKTTITATVDEILLAFGTTNGTGAQFTNIQLEVGDTATAYEPYQEQHINITPPQPMYSTSDGSIADYVDVEKGVEVYNMSGAVIFDGSEDEKWRLNASYPNTVFITANNLKTKSPILCSAYSMLTNASELNTADYGIYLGQQINIKNKDISSVEEFKELLKQNPITVVYPLATPIEIPITEEDLAKLKSLKTEQGVTNIFVGGEVKPTIEARYPRDLALVQQQLEQKVLLMSETLTATQAKLLLQGGN